MDYQIWGREEMKRILIIVFGLAIFLVRIYAWPGSARNSALYNAAYQWVNTVLSYMPGWPESQEWEGQGPSVYDGEYWVTIGPCVQAWIEIQVLLIALVLFPGLLVYDSM
jgi:hypothetical protein